MAAAGFRVKPYAAFALYAGLFLIALLPVFRFEILPLGDLANHLARAFIIDRLDDSPELQRYYTTQWHLLSFQSTDLFLPPLIHLFGMVAAARIFITVTFAVLLAGTAALHRALFGRVGLWPAVAALFLYNFPLVLGQISFLFSTGFALLLLAAWIASDGRRNRWRIAAFALGSFLLFLFHFFAFAAYALTVGAYELAALRKVSGTAAKFRRLLTAGLPLLAPMLCFLISFGAARQGPTEYGVPLAKAIALLAGIITYGAWPDIVTALALIAGIWLLHRTRRLDFAASLHLPVAALVMAAVVMPHVMTGVVGADIRIPCLLAFLLTAASEVAWRSRREAVVFAGALLVLLALRVAAIDGAWQRYDADYREFRAQDGVLPEGSRVVTFPPLRDEANRPPSLLPYWFVTTLAVADRDIFTPLLYTDATPLVFTAPGKALASDQFARQRVMHWQPKDPRFVATDPATVQAVDQIAQRIGAEDLYTSTIDWSDWPERFDYAMDIDFAKTGNPAPALLTEVARGSYFVIYRIHPPGEQ